MSQRETEVVHPFSQTNKASNSEKIIVKITSLYLQSYAMKPLPKNATKNK